MGSVQGYYLQERFTKKYLFGQAFRKATASQGRNRKENSLPNLFDKNLSWP
jgi:hypothetical protein